MSDPLALADWRRQVSVMYAHLRASPADAESLTSFRAAKDSLFAGHPESPLTADARGRFGGLAYWPHDPTVRFVCELEADPAPDRVLPMSVGDAPAFARVGWVTCPFDGGSQRLAVFWLAGYGGGLFLPFRDATSGHETYGGGRYLLDTVKGADLGGDGDRLVIDFNFAYHPSCAYDPTWSCPLAPSENWLPIPVRAGERLS